MIREISNFIEIVPRTYITESIKEGLYFIITLNSTGNYERHTTYLIKDKKNLSDEIPDIILEYSYRSSLVSMHKAIDGGKKKIHSSNPLSIIFKLENINIVDKSIEPYYKNLEKINNYSDEEKIIVSYVRKYVENDLFKLIQDQVKEKMDNKGYKGYIFTYFDYPMEYYIKFHDNYLANKLFNKTDYNEQNNEYGLSDFFNGSNSNKQFLLHQTSFFEANSIISKEIAKNLFDFESLLKNNKLPKQLPIFIDKNELNKKVINLYGYERVFSFKEIIRTLFESHRSDLSNYYLFNWDNKDGLIINDLDYVERFIYKIDGVKIKNVLDMKVKDNIVDDITIDNIFELEYKVFRKLFNNCLIVAGKDKTFYRYFGSFTNLKQNIPKGRNKVNILAYRKNIYDYIYKSKKESINGKIFYKIVISSILDDIHYNNNIFVIGEKLNILFSLNNIFDINNNNFGGLNMSTIIPEMLEKIRSIINSESGGLHLEDDNEFAFASGQLIYFLLSRSESTNKTLSLLEPFITKTDFQQYKMVITNAIRYYKHAISFNNTRFEKLASEVLGYETSSSNITTLLPIILAGCFSTSLMYEKKSLKQGGKNE